MAMSRNKILCFKVYFLRNFSCLLACMICSIIVFGQNILHEKEDRFFNGKSLSGWRVLNPIYTDFWKVKDSAIICGNGLDKIPINLFLYTDKKYKDFELRCLFRLTGDPSTGMINSGIQYRSIVEKGEMIGYQADIGEGYWGDIYDENRRGELANGNKDVLRRLLNFEGWNSYIIRCIGDRHELYINGVKTCEYVEEDESIPDEGVIALQLHSGGEAIIEYRDIFIQEF